MVRPVPRRKGRVPGARNPHTPECCVHTSLAPRWRWGNRYRVCAARKLIKALTPSAKSSAFPDSSGRGILKQPGRRVGKVTPGVSRVPSRQRRLEPLPQVAGHFEAVWEVLRLFKNIYIMYKGNILLKILHLTQGASDTEMKKWIKSEAPLIQFQWLKH